MSSETSQVQDKAYVLHSRPFKNSSLIIEVFTQHHGRLDLVARGAKRKDSELQGILQPFSPLFLVWGGRSELKALYKAETLAQVDNLRGEGLFAGFYINELIMYLLHRHEAHPLLFERYAHCLHDLASSTDMEPILRGFELDLLEELGYGLNLLSVQGSNEPVQTGQRYAYHLEHGVCTLQGHNEHELQVTGDTLLALSRRELSDAQQRLEAKRLMRAILDYHLDGRPIRARELFGHRASIPVSH